MIFLLSRAANCALTALGRAADTIEPMLPSDPTLVRANIAAFFLCLACLTPAIWRIVCRRPRALDPIWGLVSLLTLNRLTFLLHISPEVIAVNWRARSSASVNCTNPS